MVITCGIDVGSSSVKAAVARYEGGEGEVLGTANYTELLADSQFHTCLGVTTMYAAFAIPLGVIAAWRSGGIVDRVAMSFAVLGFSIPVFVLSYLLIALVSVKLQLLPVQGYVPIAYGIGPFARHLILPALSLGIINAALIARITRTTMLEVLNQDYIRAARAKGLSVQKVLIRHALKNAAVPIVTVIGISNYSSNSF